MPEISFSDGIGIAGIILAVVFLVLDKAGKLRGPWLYVLLFIAALMTAFIAIDNHWVVGFPHQKKIAITVALLCAVVTLYGGLAKWISSGMPDNAMAAHTGVIVDAQVVKGPLSLAKDLADELYALRWKLLLKHNDQVDFLYSIQFKNRVNKAIEGFENLGNRDKELSKAAKQEPHGRKEIRVIAKRLLANYKKLTHPQK